MILNRVKKNKGAEMGDFEVLQIMLKHLEMTEELDGFFLEFFPFEYKKFAEQNISRLLKTIRRELRKIERK